MPEKVILNIYDLVKPLNKGLKVLGTGAFHGGVAVFGAEWSYGFSYHGTGIFAATPKECNGPEFRESLDIGETDMTEAEVNELLERMRQEWVGTEYDLLRHNCVRFCDDFCQRLGVGHIPNWVMNLAAAGAKIGDGILLSANAAQRAATIAAAKAGQIEDKYGILGTAHAKAEDVFEAAKRMDKTFKLQERASGVASKVAQLVPGVGGLLNPPRAGGTSGGSAGEHADRQAAPEVETKSAAGKCDLCTLL